MIFANKILEFLRETGTTRKDFAEDADVPLPTLNSILGGKTTNPTVLITVKLAKAADISLDALYGLKSKDMGQEEIDRINREYEKTKDQLAQAMKNYDEHMESKQDLIESLKRENAAQAARIESQVTAIFWLRCLIGLFAALFLLFLFI